MEHKEEKYNLTKEYCANIEDHTDDPIYDDIENEVELLFVIRVGINLDLYHELSCFFLTGGQFQQCKITDRKLCPCHHCILHWKLE